MSRRLTDLHLEQYLAGTLSEAQRREVEATLAASPDDAQALRSLEADTQALFTTLPPKALAARLVPEPEPTRRRWLGWLGALAGAAAAASVGALLLRPPAVVDDGLTAKGGVAWRVDAKAGEVVRTLRAGELVAPGETLSFQVTSPEPAFAAVLSKAPDGVFVYVPAQPVGRGVTALAVGARLDDALGAETLWLMTSPRSFDAEGLKGDVERGAIPAGFTVTTVPMLKATH